MKALAIALTAVLALPLAAQVADGDRHYAARAEGAQGAHAAATHMDAAIAAYQHAVAQNPNDLETQGKLLRAYRYKGAYVATSNEQKKQIYGAAKKAGDAALGGDRSHAAPRKGSRSRPRSRPPTHCAVRRAPRR